MASLRIGVEAVNHQQAVFVCRLYVFFVYLSRKRNFTNKRSGVTFGAMIRFGLDFRIRDLFRSRKADNAFQRRHFDGFRFHSGRKGLDVEILRVLVDVYEWIRSRRSSRKERDSRTTPSVHSEVIEYSFDLLSNRIDFSEWARS